MKRKIAALLCAATLAMGLVGCGNQKQETGTDKADTQISTQEEAKQKDTQQEQPDTTSEITDTEQEQTAQATNIMVTYEQIDEVVHAEDNVTEVLNTNYQKPIVTIEGNEAAADKLNKKLEEQEAQYKADKEQMISDALLVYADQPDDFYAYWLSVSYETQRCDSHVLALRQMYSSNEGSAHSMYAYNGYNMDTKTGELLTLDSISDDKEALLASAQAYIMKQLESPVYADKLLAQGDANAETVKSSMLVEGKWYFSDAGITFVSDAYLLAPYSEGAWFFTVPYDEIQGLKEEYNYDPKEEAWQKIGRLGTSMTADLNGDGTDDEVYLSIAANDEGGEAAIDFTINGTDYSQMLLGDDTYITDGATWTQGYYLIDIDQNDSFKEIAIMDNGASDDYATYFFRYTGSDLVYLGCVEDLLSYSSCRARGDGTITAGQRLAILETANFIGTYEIGNEGKLELRHQDMYDIDHTYYSVGSTSHNILKDVTVYTDPDQNSEKKVLTVSDGPVIFTCVDNEHWAELVTQAGQTYYLYLSEYNVLETGETAQDVFEDLPLAD